MKRLFAVVALFATVAAPSFAMTSATGLNGAVRHEAQRLVPEADFDNISSAQKAQIESYLTLGREASGTDAANVIRKILERG